MPNIIMLNIKENILFSLAKTSLSKYFTSLYHILTTDHEGIICNWLGFQRKEASVTTDLFTW